MELPVIFFLAPDVFNRSTGSYPVAPLTDYEEQTRSRNRIRNMFINSTKRTICYDQPIFNDNRLELSEYAGLQLNIRDASVSLVVVQEQYDNAAIRIVDDDDRQLLQKFVCVFIIRNIEPVSTKILMIHNTRESTLQIFVEIIHLVCTQVF